MRNCFCVAAILLTLIPVTVFSQATYDAKRKLLSVKSEGRPLKDLLSEVSAETGIDIYVSPAVDKKVFADIERQPLEDAIRRMVRPLNSAFIYLGESIEAVKVFERSEADATLKITHGGMAPRVTRPTRTSPSLGQGLDKRWLTREELGAKAKIAEPQGQTRALEPAEKGKTREERGSGKGAHQRKGRGKKWQREPIPEEGQQNQVEPEKDREKGPEAEG